MKNVFLIVGLSCLPFLVYGQVRPTATVNQVRTWMPSKPGYRTFNDVLIGASLVDGDQHVRLKSEYYDGVGRVMQQVVWKGSPAGHDVVRCYMYNTLGLREYDYLPVVTAAADGLYKPVGELIDPVTHRYKGLASGFYAAGSDNKIADDETTYRRIVFEASPLRRAIEEMGVGKNWSDQQKAIQMSYLINRHGTAVGEERIIAWTIDANDMPAKEVPVNGLIETGGYYSSGQLNIRCRSDEAGNTVREYTNRQGRIVLRKVQVVANSTDLNSKTQWALTYFIYDDRGNIVCVIPPEATGTLDTDFFRTNATVAVKESFLSRWAYRYRYDRRGRVTHKFLPGAEPVYLVYDYLDRLVLSQDGNQRAGVTNAMKYWTFMKYDELGRLVATGVKDTLTETQLTQTAMQKAVDDYYTLMKTTKPWRRPSEYYVGTGAVGHVHGYTNNAYPVCTSGTFPVPDDYLLIKYYDHYDFRSGWNGDYRYINDGLAETVSGHEYQQAASEAAQVRGYATGLKAKVLDDGMRGGSMWIKSVTYYNPQYRVVETVSDNQRGGADRTSILYDFVGKVIKTQTSHTTCGIAWTDMIGVNLIGNKLFRNITNNTWGQSGAASKQTLPAGESGWVEFVATETNTSRMLGLSAENADAHNNTIGYALYLRNDGGLIIREGAIDKLTIPQGYSPGDVLRIERKGTAIQYYKNNVEIYPAGAVVTQTPSTTSLLVDVAFATSRGSLSNVRGSFVETTQTVNRRFVYDPAGRLQESYHSLGKPVTWEGLVGVRATGTVLVKNGSTSAFDAGAVSKEFIVAGKDGWLEFRAADRTTARMIGFSSENTTAGYGDLAYAFYLKADGSLTVFENGQDREVIGSYQTDDIIRIERRDGVVHYKVNDVVIHTSSESSTSALRVDCSLYTAGSSLRHVYMGSGNGASEVLLARSTYNELGQLVDKDLHSVNGGVFKQSVDYRYNIRGWLTSINDASLTNDGTVNDDSNVAEDYFGINLAYNTIDPGLGNSPQHNGNISGIRWSNNLGLGVTQQNGYTYGYDAMNRLTGSVFKEQASGVWMDAANNGLAESNITYDLNGNIRTLTRNDNRASGTMDVLTYDYGVINSTQSNRLLAVRDDGDKSNGFIDGTNSGIDYSYDANGNLRRDLNRGIGTSTSDSDNIITYNVLNLPQTVTKSGVTMRYIYDATGRKLSQQVGLGQGMKQRDYIGEFVYDDDALELIQHDEGRIVMRKPQVVYANACDNTDDVTVQAASVATVTIGSENYIRAVANGTPRPGIFPVGPGVAVRGGERYKVRAKAYRMRGTVSTSHSANLLIKTDGKDLAWPGALLPVGTTTMKSEFWIEQIVTIPAGHTLLEAGVVGNSTFAVGEELYLNEFEIIRLDNQSPEYQYFIKDHLGNVRVTFTSRPAAPETFTTSFESEDNEAFSHYSKSIFDLADHTDAATTYTGVQKLNGGVNGRVGVAKIFTVMPGDVIRAEAYGKYMNTSTVENPNVLTHALAAAFGVSAPSSVDQLAAFKGLNSYAALVENGIRADDSNEAPKAFVNVLFFDKNHKLVDAAWDQITTDGEQTNSAAKQAHDLLQVEAVATEPGYAYVYVSNEDERFVDVYFDDVTFTYEPSAIVAMDDYYAFGMNFNSFLRENNLTNQLQYNGKEVQDELAIGWLDYGARMYMPDIARWGVVDPLTEMYQSLSPYNYVANNPVRFVDPDGMKIQATIDAILAIYHSMDQGESVTIELDEFGYVKDEPLQEQAANSNSLVLKDFYFLAQHESIVEVSVADDVSYLDENGKPASYEFDKPEDVNSMEMMYAQNKELLDKEGVSKEQYFKQLASFGIEPGTQVNGSLGHTLLPHPKGETANSTNDNIQVIINGKGSLNHRAVGVAHEFVHVILFLKGEPDGHPQADPEIEKRTWEVKKRLGYDH